MFRARLWCLIDILRLLFEERGTRRYSSPHVRRSHWLIWATPSTILMGPTDAAPPLKIYGPIDWPSITGHAQWAPSSGKKLRADQFITEALGLPVNPTHMTEHQQD